MNSGHYKDYFWVQWESAFIDRLLDRIPDIVVGRYLVNTSFDSGRLCPSDVEQLQGWRSVDTFTYSPRIIDISAIPHYCFEEWLAFDSPTELSNWEPVINYFGFTLAEPPDAFLAAKLWSQLERVRPESYLGLGDRWLIFVTRIRGLHELALVQTDLENTAPNL